MTDKRADIIYWYTMGSLRRDLLEETLEGEPLLPALAELAQGSVWFDGALACSGNSFLSTASMLTGRWPSRLGLTDCPVRVHGRGLRQACGLDSGIATLPAWLAGNGFSTFSHPDSLTPFPGDGLERGFSHPGLLPEALEEGRGIFIWHQAKACRPPLEPTGLARRALGLDERSLDPTDPGDLKDLYRAAAFDADRALARALGELGQAGLWDRSLIVVTADTGLELFEHGDPGSTAGLYQENLAVPLFIKFPADHALAGRHGQRVETRVRLVDLAPTLSLIGAGREMPDTDGAGLEPVISGEEKDHRDLIAFQSVLTKDKEGPVVYEALASIRGPHKASGGFRPTGEEIRELYDLASDPSESGNIMEREPDLYEEIMIRAASAAMPAALPGQDRPSPAGEDEKEALAEKLRSLGYL